MQALDSIVGLQTVSENGNALGITPATALKSDIKHLTVNEVEANLRSTDALSLVSKLFIHGKLPFLFCLSYTLGIASVAKKVKRRCIPSIYLSLSSVV